MTGMSLHERPMTGMSRHEEPQRPMTGMSRAEEPLRPMTGMSTRQDSPQRPMTGVSQHGEPIRGSPAQTRGRPMTAVDDESPPASQRSRSRGGSQSPLKGVINEHPLEGMTSFCRQDSSSSRHARNFSRRSSGSSTYSSSEAPTHASSDSSLQLNTPVRSAMRPPSPNVLHKRDRGDSKTTAPLSPSKKSHSFWNFGSKSPKQSTPKSTPTNSPVKNSKSMPTGMAISVPSLEVGGQRTSPGNFSRRGGSEEPIPQGASVQLNIGNNVLDVSNPDAREKKTARISKGDDEVDPLMAALEDLKMASKTPKSPSKRFTDNTSYDSAPPNPRRHSRDENPPQQYDNRRPPSRQEIPQSMRPASSQAIRQNQTPPSRGNQSQSSDQSYDPRRNTLGAPPPAHSAAEMERTRRQYAAQVHQVLSGRPQTTQQPLPRSTSPRPMSRQSYHEDNSYNGRPESSMGMVREMPPRSRSPAPQGMPPRSRSPAPPRPVSRQESMDYMARPMSRQEYDAMRRRSVSPAPYQGPPRGYPDEAMRRSPSPQPYARSASPNPRAGRPKSSLAGPISANNPFGISMDRYGNVVDANPRSASPQPHQGYAYGNRHRHDVDDSSRYPAANPMMQARARSKSQSDLRGRGRFTEDGRAVLFIG